MLTRKIYKCYAAESPRSLLRRALRADQPLVPVEVGEVEAREVLVVGEAVVLQQLDRDLLAQKHRLGVVRAPVDARDVARDGDVRGQLVQFAADRQLADVRVRAVERDERGAVGAGHDRLSQVAEGLRFVEPSLQYRHAGPGQSGVPGPGGRVHGAPVGERLRQEIRAERAGGPGGGGRLVDGVRERAAVECAWV